MNDERRSNAAAVRPRFGSGVRNLPRHEPDEMVRLGEEAYARQVRPHLTDADRGKYVAVDVEGRGWELDEHEREAVDRLGARVPDAQIYLKRVGFRAVGIIGGSRSALETGDL